MTKTANQDLQDMTASELHDMAKERGLSGTSHMRKEELIEALNEAQRGSGGRNEATDRPRDEQGHFEKQNQGKKK